MEQLQDSIVAVIRELVIGTPLHCTQTLAKIVYGEQTLQLLAGKKYDVIDAIYKDSNWQFNVVDEQGQPIWVDSNPYFQF